MTNNRMKGIKKCILKNNFNVMLFTINPPHTNVTIISPYIGITDKSEVITTQAQYLI